MTSQSHANLLPAGQTAVGTTLFRSAVFHVPENAAVVTFVVLGSIDGTLDIEALYVNGDEGTVGDWWVYNTSAEQVAVTGGEPARITIEGGAPIMRILYTPDSAATVTRAEGIYTRH